MSRIVFAYGLLLAAVFVWTAPGWCATEGSILASGVRSGRGSVAWSPDGRRLAYVRKQVELYDFKGRAAISIKTPHPYFVEWSAGGDLLVLHGREGKRELTIVFPDTLKTRAIPLGVEVDSLCPLDTPDTVLLTAVSSSKTKKGEVALHYKLFMLDMKTGALHKRFDLQDTLSFKDAGMASLVGWMHGGLHPLELSAVLLEYVHPPKHNPYMKLGAVDFRTGHQGDIYRASKGVAFVPSVSFSPFGTRVALATVKGELRVLSLGGGLTALDDSVEGFHPSWSPGGDWIYFGGMLLSTSDKGSRRLLRRASRSSADWSPDGLRLAVSSGGKLWVFDTKGLDSQPPVESEIQELRSKVRLLRELLEENFLDDQEYIRRYRRLVGRNGQ